MRGFYRNTALLLLLVFGGVTIAVLADNSEYASPSFDAKHGGSFAFPNERVDNFSGALNIVERDVILRGPNGFDLAVTRWYSSKINVWDANCILGSREVGPLGVGWKIHQGRLWDNPNDPFTTVPAYRMELPGGVHESFYTDDVLGVPNADYVSPGGWSLRDEGCVGAAGQCWVAASPAGVEYHFPRDDSAYRMDPDNSYIYVRTIIDPRGNQQTVNYDFGCNCNQAYILSITDTWGRTVDFNYVDGGGTGPKVCSLDPSETCFTDGDCQNYCSGGGAAEPCTFDTDCGEGTCSDDGQPCDSQLDCDRNCSNNPGVSCTADIQCGASHCVGGLNNNEQCYGPLDCDGMCVGGYDNGQQCDYDWQCDGRCLILGSSWENECNNDWECRKACDGGTNNGQTCTSSLSCPNACVGGTNNGGTCNSNFDCPDACVGVWPDHGTECTYDWDCDNYCTGGQYNGQVPPSGSCSNNIQCPNMCVGGSNHGFLGCSYNFQCPGGTCSIGTCTDADCANDGECDISDCVQGDCVGGDNCEQGTCVGPTCLPQPTCDNPGVCLDSICLDSTGPQYLDSITVAWVNGTATYQYTVDATSHIDPVLQSFTNPASQTTVYDYDPGSGDASHDLELKQIGLPTGGQITYDYADHQFHYPLRDTGQGIECTRVVTDRSLGSDTWTFDFPTGQPGDRTTVVTDPQGDSRRYTHFAYSDLGPDRIWKAGLLERMEVVDGGTVLLEEEYTYEPQQISGDNVSTKSGYIEPAQIGRQKIKETTRNPGNKTSRVEAGGWDAYGNIAWQKEYDFGGGLYRQTEYEYAHASATFENQHIVNLPTSIRSENASGSKVGEILHTYDTSNSGSNAFGRLDNSQTWTGSGYVTSSFQYDSVGDLSQQQMSGGGVTRTTDLVYTRGTLDRVTRGGRTLFDRTINLDSSLITAEQNANGGTTTFGYDNASRLTTINPPGSEPTTTISYGTTTITVSRGTENTLYTYDGFGRLKSTRSKIDGSTYTYDVVDYDSRGDVLRQYEASHSSSPSAFTSYTRDALRRPTVANSPDGTTTFTYTGDETTINDGVSTREITTDAFGRVTQVREGSYTTTYQYDELDNLTLVNTPGVASNRLLGWSAAGWLLSVNHPESGLSQYGVNGVGERTSTTDADGETETYTLDAEGRVTQIDRLGTDNDVSFYYDGDPVPGHSAGYTNASGFLTGMADATGTTVWTDRDILGRVLQVEHKRGPDLYVTDLQYDGDGNLSSVDYPRTGTSRTLVTYTYNDGGLVDGLSLNGDPIVTDVRYNPLMTPDHWVYANGVTVSVPTAESERNRPIEISTVGATIVGADADVLLDFNYNTRGQVSSIHRNGVLESYGYESDRGFLASVSYGGTSVSYSHDADGNLSSRSSTAFPQLNFSRSHSNNRIAGCNYSSSGNLLNCEGHTYTYTSNGKVKNADGLVQYTYDGNGRLSETLVLAESLVRSDVHADGLGRLSRFEGAPGGPLAPKTDWIYAADRLVASIDHDDTCCEPTTCADEGAECGIIPDGCGSDLSCGGCPIGDDCIDNVCECQPQTCADQNITCGSATDGCGNSIYCGSCGGGGGGGCSIGGEDVIRHLEPQQNDGWDEPGIQLCNNLGSWPLGYSTDVDYEQPDVDFIRVKESATVPAGVGYRLPVEFDPSGLGPGTYDARVTVTFDDPKRRPVITTVSYEVTEEMAGAAPAALLEPSLSASPPDEGYSQSEVLSGRTGAVLRWYVADHRGTTMLVLDELGEVVGSYDYFPYGGFKEEATCSGLEGEYQGSLRDQVSGLYDLGARHYGDDLARFLVPDTVMPDPRRPSGWNLYAYANNDPVNWVDPDGKCAVPAGLGEGAVGLCFEGFINTKIVPGKLAWVVRAKGDGPRPFSGTDGTLSNRFQVQAIVDLANPSKSTTKIVNAQRMSETAISSDLGATTVKTNVQVDGDEVFISLNVEALNGATAAGKPGAPKDPINGILSVWLDADGNVVYAQLQADSYPTIAAYAYTVDGEAVNTTVLFEEPENKIKDLDADLELKVTFP